MEILFFLICTGGMMVLVFGSLFGGMFFWNRHESKRWQQAAQALGLRLERNPRYSGALFKPYYVNRMVGRRGGLPVAIGVRVVSSGSGDNRSTTYYTYAVVDFERSLELGLRARAKHAVSRLLSAVVGESDVQVGDPEIDPYYSIWAAEPEMVQRLFGVPYVGEALRWHREAPFRPQIDDDSVRVETRGKELDPTALGRAMDGAVDLARRVLAARGEIGVTPAEEAVTTSWRQVAQARGFTLDLENTRMHGRYEGVYVDVDTKIQNGGRVTQFTVRYDRPLGVGLKLTRQGSMSGLGKLLGMQDIEVGDPMFDGRFVVKGSPERAVRALLTPEVRARLVDLQSQASHLEVADDRLVAVVGWLVADARWLESGIAAIAKAGAALAQVTPGGVGPYRRA